MYKVFLYIDSIHVYAQYTYVIQYTVKSVLHVGMANVSAEDSFAYEISLYESGTCSTTTDFTHVCTSRVQSKHTCTSVPVDSFIENMYIN